MLVITKIKEQVMPIKTVDSATLKRWMDSGEAVVVDVREPAEHAAEKIHGAKLVPLSQFDIDKIPFASDKYLVLHCQSGNRSAQAANKLLTSGVETVIHLEGGLNAWKKSGYSIQANQILTFYTSSGNYTSTSII